MSARTLAGLLRVRTVVLVLSFLMALIPLAHKFPAIGALPRIGPFNAEPFRASVLVFCALIVIIDASLGRKWADRGRLQWAGYGIDALLFAVIAYASWRFYVDVTAMHTAIMFFEPYQAWTVFFVCLALLFLTYRIWGAPLAIVGLIALAYFMWQFRDTIVDSLTENMWMALDDGILGNIADIVLSTVFPFIILGAMLEGTGAGMSLIRVSFHAMRRFRGGPAHAAVLASGLFGTVSGSSVANVVGTGVITIPLIKQRGFSSNFAGGVEATASTGGQIMPPIMGAAALVMADFIGLSYIYVIVAAIVPAVFYYLALFTAIVFESRRLGIEASETVADELKVSRQDYINLALIGIPILTVIVTLIRGASPAGAALFALAVLIVISFINPDIRRNPFKLVIGFAEGGLTFARLFIAVCTISIVVGALSSTGLPTELALSLNKISGGSILITLLLAAGASILLGMGMPTLPAYLTIIVIMGSTMRTLGLEPLTAHMFVFYFGVASSITPPVALTAYAAAAISGGRPIQTGVAAVRIGLIIFALPFFWAYNPMMLIVPQTGVPFQMVEFLFILVRLVAMTYLLASGTSRFDARPLHPAESAGRVVLGLLMIVPSPLVWGSALIAMVALAILQRRRPAIAA